MDLAHRGTRIRLAISNHDNVLRNPMVQRFVAQSGLIEVEEECYYSDGRSSEFAGASWRSIRQLRKSITRFRRNTQRSLHRHATGESALELLDRNCTAQQVFARSPDSASA